MNEAKQRAARSRFGIRLLWLTLLVLFWAFLGLMFAFNMVFIGFMDWAGALRIAARDWVPWMLLSPLVIWLARRYPFETGVWPRRLLVHFCAGVVVVMCSELLARSIDAGFGPMPGPPFRGFGGPKHEPHGPPPGHDREPGTGPGPRAPGGPGEFREGRPPGLRPPDVRGGSPARGPGPPFAFSLRSLLMWANFRFPIYCFIVSATQAFTYFQRSRDREQKAVELQAQLTSAKLQSLRMQLHPHFLFNTLHAISTLVHKDTNAADEMIVNLSELLRACMEDSDQQEIPLKKELDFMNRYLEIQQVRFSDHFTVEQDIPEETLAAQVPVMILQPLVENAIRHGIEPHASQGTLWISARKSGDILQLSVSDSGTGPAEVTTPDAKPEREGVGLKNTQARLQQLYGEESQLRFEKQPGRFTVVIEIPYHEQPAVNPPAYETPDRNS